MSGGKRLPRNESLTSSGTSGRFETFTEAVPLALSSMAHASLPLEEGVVDGLRQVLSHTLLSCVNYARIMHKPHQWSFRDIKTSEYAWEPIKGEGRPKDLPFSLERLKFEHHYVRSAFLYLGADSLPKDRDTARLFENSEWPTKSHILGRVSLHYASTEKLTAGELDGSETEDVPPTILYKTAVQYRSLPATGNQQAVQAEELSMLSFGGSVDDDVKFGALAALYDQVAKYVLEIYSVRGKKYKFDLMDSTLSDGTIPRLPSSCEGDPFVKSLCATVTDHVEAVADESESMDESEQGTKQYPYALTTIQLSLEGKPRTGKELDNLPDFDAMMKSIMSSFLMFRPKQPAMATALPSGHILLLDPSLAGRIFINGRYVTTWGEDPRIGCDGVALFGMDLHSIPFWHGQIVDYEAVKVACGLMWHEIMIDARLAHLNIASRLLHRLMSGSDPIVDEGDEDDSFYEEFNDENVERDCLESQVLSSPLYDVVGIAPKALATRFFIEFGEKSFPCQPHEVEWVKHALPNRTPVLAPLRVLKILQRGGIFDVQKTCDDLWFSSVRPVADGPERSIVSDAIALLENAGCEDITVENIVFTSLPQIKNAIENKSVCRFMELQHQFSVHEKYLDISVAEYCEGAIERDSQIKAYLLGFYLAQAYPDGKLLPRYVLRNPSPLS